MKTHRNWKGKNQVFRKRSSMGSTYSTHISSVEVSKSPSWQDQSVVYSTPESRTCTLRVRVGVDSAIVTLRDYTFDREGTRVDISVVDLETNKEGVSEVGSLNCKNWGNAVVVRKDAGLFGIGYGVPKVWYDAGKGSFMCNIMGPYRHSSMMEFSIAMKKAYSDVVDSPNSTGQGSTITHVINNPGGPFYGPLSGSMITDSMINFFNVFYNSKSS